MNRAAKAYRVMSRVSVWPLSLVLVSVALIWAVLMGDLQREYRESIAGAERETAALVRGLGETTLASFDMIDQSLLQLREAYVRDPDHFDVHAWYDARRLGGDPIIQAAIVGPDGIVRQSNLPVAPGTDLSDREHVRIQKESRADAMFISVPVIGRVSKKKTINVTRKIINPDGSYGGVVVVSIGLDYLVRFYEALPASGLIELVGSEDGIIRARAPSNEELIGRKEADLGVLDQSSQADLFQTRTIHDASGRIVSYRRLWKYNLVVLAGLDLADVLDEYNRDRSHHLLAGIFLTALLGLFAALLLRQRRQMLTSRDALTGTLENISQGILMVDADGRVPVFNRRVLELLGLPDSLMARNPTFRQILEYQLATNEFGPPGKVDPEFLKFVNSGGIARGNHVYERVRPDGTALEIRTQTLPNGSAVRTYTDITERRRNEAALAAARDAAEAGARARAQFIAITSHEIRTPLNGILGVAQLLQGLDLGPTAAEYADVIINSGNHLLAIINDILDFSSMDASRLELEAAPFDLREALRNVLDMLGHQADLKGLRLTLRIADDVPRHLVGDAQRLRQIVLNLAGNGIKFTQSGSVRIEVRKVSDEGAAVRLGFSIADTGIGISAEAQQRLFSEFTQVDSSIRRRFGGSGLGLAISRRLVEMMDGHISVESAPGRGSTFRFDVRLGVAAAEAIPGLPAASAERHDAAPAAPLHVLVAEDNPTNRYVATQMLERLGFRVTAVPDGLAAVEAVRTGIHDVVLMDVMMPEMDGLAATRAIRDTGGARAGIAIIGLTASATEDDAAACRAAGMDDVLTKPVKLNRLQEVLREVLQRRAVPV